MEKLFDDKSSTGTLCAAHDFTGEKNHKQTIYIICLYKL